MNFFKTIGNNILIELEKKNWSNSDMAYKVGISLQSLEKILDGKKIINIYEISKIADILEIPKEKLLNNCENNHYYKNSHSSFGDKFDNKENFNTIYSMIEEYFNMQEDLNEFKLSKKFNSKK